MTICNKPTACIIQPGRLGDIIICLPIAKFYYDRGYDVIWPILTEYADTFRNIDYVKCKPFECHINQSVPNAVKFSKDCNLIIDLSFGFLYSKMNYYFNNLSFAPTFVHAKYKLAKVPITERWNLQYTRNVENENLLYEDLIKNKEYTLTHLNHSGGEIKIKQDIKNRIEFKPYKNYNIFDWRKVIYNAKDIICADSSLCNLIESDQKLYFKPKTFVDNRPRSSNISAEWANPTLDNNWTIRDKV